MQLLNGSGTYLIVPLFIAALFITGCDSSENGGSVSQAALEDMNGMMTDVFSVLDEISFELEGNPTTTSALAAKGQPTAERITILAAKSSKPSFQCEGGGHVDYDVVNSESDFSWSLAFNDCDGINGALDFGVHSSDQESQPFVTEFYMDGELNERCTLRYDDWKQTTSFSFDEESQEFAGTIVYDGGISAICGNESFSCSYDNVTVDFSDGMAGDISLFESNCR